MVSYCFVCVCLCTETPAGEAAFVRGFIGLAKDLIQRIFSDRDRQRLRLGVYILGFPFQSYVSYLILPDAGWPGDLGALFIHVGGEVFSLECFPHSFPCIKALSYWEETAILWQGSCL